MGPGRRAGDIFVNWRKHMSRVGKTGLVLYRIGKTTESIRLRVLLLPSETHSSLECNEKILATGAKILLRLMNDADFVQ